MKRNFWSATHYILAAAVVLVISAGYIGYRVFSQRSEKNEAQTVVFPASSELLSGPYKAHFEHRASANPRAGLSEVEDIGLASTFDFDADLNVMSERDYDVTTKNISKNTQDINIVKNRNIYTSVNGGEWSKSEYSGSFGKGGTIVFSTDQFDSIRSGSMYRGSVSCARGTCDHWQYQHDGNEIQVFVDSEKKLVKYTSVHKNGETTVIDFDFASAPTVRAAPL